MSNPMPLYELTDLVRQAAYDTLGADVHNELFAPIELEVTARGRSLGTLENVVMAIANTLYDFPNAPAPAKPLMCAGCLARQLRDGTEPKPAITIVPVVGATCDEHFAYGLKLYGAGDLAYVHMVER